MRRRKTVKSIEKKHQLHIPLWLGFVLVAVLILRIPSLFEPYSYGDEMIYMALGDGIQKGLVLYKDIHDNKPPLLYFTAALASNLFWFKGILMLWMLGTVVGFWKLLKRLFPKNNALQKTATVAFALLTTLPLLEGNIVNSELFMIGMTIAALLVLLRDNLTPKHLLLGGILFSLGALFKIPAAFDVPVLFVYWFFTINARGDTLGGFIKKVIWVSIGFFIPITITLIWYASRGAFNQYFVAAYLQNVGYLSSFRPDDAQKSFLVKNGPLLFRAVFVSLFTLGLFLVRKKISRGFLLASLWLIISLFAVTLSERPYPHYLIQSLPAISILIGILVASPKMEQPFTVIPLFVALFVPVYYKFYYYNTFAYYSRFVEFASGKLSTEQYFAKFDGNVNRNYKVAQFLQNSSLPSDQVFVWGDSPPIYALSKRLPPIKYVAGYHINDFSSQEEVLLSLAQSPPLYVVVLPDSPSFVALSPFLRQNYVHITTIEGASVFKRVSKGIISLFD